MLGQEFIWLLSFYKFNITIFYKKVIVEGKKGEEYEKRTHMFCEGGGAVEAVLGETSEEGGNSKLIGVLKKQEGNGKFFSKEM